MTSSIRTLLLLLILPFVMLPAVAQEPAAPTAESRLRDALKNTMLQLRDAQNQVAILQAAQTGLETDKTDLQAKVDALTGQLKSANDQAALDKSTSEKSIADLTGKLTESTTLNGKLNEAIKQWKDAYNQVAALANTKEAERAKLAAQAASLQILVDDRERKNFALYKVGNEILTRYEHYSLGDALSAKEPFVGVTRVKIENLVQDYKDQLLNQAVTAGQPAPQPKMPPASSPAPAPAKAISAKPATAKN